MAKPIPSHATPSMLKWAREQQHLKIQEVSRALGIAEQTLLDWESGNASPSIAKLRLLAKRYKRPLMVFYLASPVHGFSIVKDFRTLRNGAAGEFSTALNLAIRVAQERQAWAEEAVSDEGEEPLDYVGSYTIKSEVHEVATAVREKLGITADLLSLISSTREAFKLWRSRIESIGCFVFQVPRVDIKEMRGFALPNRLAPTIAVNIKDTYAARIFTMIHELCHVYVGETGVTGAGKLQFAPNSRNPIERFCNRVAARTLVPSRDLMARVPDNWTRQPDETVRQLAAVYKVSRPVILIRLFDIGIAKKEYVRSKFAVFNRAPKAKQIGTRRGGPKTPQLVIARSGEAFSRLAVSAYHSGTIHGGQLSSLLNIKMKDVSSLERRLYTGQQSGPP
jgi:Zn-dependent peptidase ImmA (M78 family)/transcriptional regulator with XRE-family HTH domain